MRQHSRSNPRTLHPARWSMLFLWWVTHALVGGSVRVAFETELISITRSPRFALREADLPWLLQTGTISTVTGKLLCGPIVAWLGLRLVGLASLLLCGVILLGVAVSGPEGGPLVPLFVAWNLIRLFQVATWPATNQLLAAWFPTAEHGRAWGIMSTASRVGIICVTIAVSLRDTWQAAGDRVIKEHAGGDSSDAVQGTFFVVGVAMVLWAGVIYALLQNFPVQQIDFDGLGRDDGDEMAWNRFLQLLVATMRRPMFIFGLVAQGMATPIAEFQSQVPLLISRDKLLTPGDIGPSLTLWHLGVLWSVLISGFLFDRSSVLQRIPLIGGPVLLNALLFASLVGFPTLVQGRVKQFVVFALGASGSPANFLLASNLISQHASPPVMATISALMDLVGYAVTLLVLNGLPGVTDRLYATVAATLVSGFLCAVFTSALYIAEHLSLRANKGVGSGARGWF